MQNAMGQAYRDSGTVDFESTTRADKFHLLFKQSFPAVFISLANATLLLIILWQDLGHQKLLAWYAAVIVASLIRILLFTDYRRRSVEGDAILSWQVPYFLTLLLSALVWGVGGLWLIIWAPLEEQLIIFFFLMGMAGGAISVYSAIRSIVLVSVASVLAPATVWFLLFGEAGLFYAAIGSTLFLISCVRSTKVLSTALHKSFLLSHQLSHAKDQAELMARTDYLTGLNNRGAFNEFAKVQMTYCQRHKLPASVIALDLDDFKKINDTHGHSAGDNALRGFSQLITLNTRASDICGRIGGEEFAIFLPNTNLEDAVVVAEKIREALDRNPVQHEGERFQVTASLGVATGVYDLEQLLALADSALYSAKKAGKNQVRWTDMNGRC